MDHTTRAVLAQADVEATTNEIARFRPLLDGFDLADTVLTADALHAQREHAEWLVTAKHAASLMMVKANQPTLHQQLRRLPWGDILPKTTPATAATAESKPAAWWYSATGCLPSSRAAQAAAEP